MSENKILVPIDFSSVSPVQMGHALSIAERIGACLQLMHLVDKEQEVAAAQTKLEDFIVSMKAEYNTKVAMHALVKPGKILKDIGPTAEELKAEMVVLGTHGLQGLEYIVGTHAVRIVATAQVPFIVVQEKAIAADGYCNIIVPMDLASESKQKLSVIAGIAKIFDSQVHIVIPHEDDEFLQNALKRNLTYTETFFKQMGVRYTATLGTEDSDDLDKEVAKLAAEKDGDLIAIMNEHESKMFGLIGSDITQDVMLNEAMIPVLVMNPKVISDFNLFGSASKG